MGLIQLHGYDIFTAFRYVMWCDVLSSVDTKVCIVSVEWYSVALLLVVIVRTSVRYTRQQCFTCFPSSAGAQKRICRTINRNDIIIYDFISMFYSNSV